MRSPTGPSSALAAHGRCTARPLRAARLGGLLAAVCAAAIAVGGCSAATPGTPSGSAGPAGAATSTGAVSPTGSPGAGPAITPTATVTIPSDAVGRQLRWMVGQMNSDAVTADTSTRFTDAFLAQVPPAQWLLMLGQLRAQAPWVVESVETDGSTGAATLVARGRRYRLTMTVADSGRIDGALLKEAAQGQAATDWAGVERRAVSAAPQTSILAAQVAADGTLEVVHRSGDQGLRPIASMFKLYVLAAVAEQVRAGRLGWDTRLTLTAADKTLPSGTLQERPDGATISVREAAALMIRISDNTAADLLMRTVGEPAVRAAAARAGHRHPEAITPFLTPKQMFWLAYGNAEAAVAARGAWRSADVARRRELLAAVPMPGPGPEAIDPHSTHWRQGIEWFATPEEIVRAHLRLDELAGTTAGRPLREILTANGGVQVTGWKDQAFKGGSDAAVIALSFLAPAAAPGGRRQALVMIGTGDGPVDEETFVAATGDAARLLAEDR